MGRRSPLSLAADIVETARAMLRLGLVTGTSGNVSAREGALVRITPSGLPYSGMTVNDLVTITMDGAVLAGEHEPSSEWRVHVAVYAARPDARVLVHTHSEHATAWSESGEPLALAPGCSVLTAPFAPSGSDEIATAAVTALGDREAVLLGHHGVLAVGETPAIALEVCAAVERAAEAARGA
jgi:L-fuculose-phosphate aldolase